MSYSNLQEFKDTTTVRQYIIDNIYQYPSDEFLADHVASIWPRVPAQMGAKMISYARANLPIPWFGFDVDGNVVEASSIKHYSQYTPSIPTTRRQRNRQEDPISTEAKKLILLWLMAGAENDTPIINAVIKKYPSIKAPKAKNLISQVRAIHDF